MLAAAICSATQAAAARVPIVENKIVARLLYKKVEVGAQIPVELYQAVAEICR